MFTNESYMTSRVVRSNRRPDNEIDLRVSTHTVDEFYQLLNDSNITGIVIRGPERRGGVVMEDTSDIEDTWVREGLDMSSFVDIPDLTSMKLSGYMRIKNMKFLGSCKKLRNLYLKRVLDIDFSQLRNCDSLEHLKVVPYNTRYMDLSPLSRCKSLKSIDVGQHNAPSKSYAVSSRGLIGIRLPSNDSLEVLNLSENLLVTRFMMDCWPKAYKHLTEYRTAKGVMWLKKKHLLDLSQLKNCSSLKRIDLRNNRSLFAIDLSELESLDEVTIDLIGNPLRAIHKGSFAGKILFPFSFKSVAEVDKKGK
jgi:hypothetical protein